MWSRIWCTKSKRGWGCMPNVGCTHANTRKHTALNSMSKTFVRCLKTLRTTVQQRLQWTYPSSSCLLWIHNRCTSSPLINTYPVAPTTFWDFHICKSPRRSQLGISEESWSENCPLPSFMENRDCDPCEWPCLVLCHPWLRQNSEALWATGQVYKGLDWKVDSCSHQ